MEALKNAGTKFFHDNGRLCTNPAIVFNVVCNLLLRRHVTCILVSDGPLKTATSNWGIWVAI